MEESNWLFTHFSLHKYTLSCSYTTRYLYNTILFTPYATVIFRELKTEYKMEPNIQCFRKKVNRIRYCLPYSKAVAPFFVFIFQHSNAVCECVAQKGVTSPGKA